jgi:UDP-2-acetamido-3-amino-2,3-dideoxy-glucuronate N-acetyltransferase
MLALVGGGYWGKNLIRNFRALDVLSIVCDRDEDALERALKRYPGLEVTKSYADLLNRPEIEAIAIATPAELHYNQAREALLAGKDVYVEKPLALSRVEAEELVALADQHDCILMVGHLLQYHSAFLRLKEVIQAGHLGRVDYIYSHRLNLGKIRREENALWSFAPHDISMILSLAGEMPEAIFATGGNYLHRKIADVTTTHMKFSSGLGAQIFVSWLHPFKEQKLVVVGEKQMAVFDDVLPWNQKLVLYPHQIEWKNGIPVPLKADGEPVSLAEVEPLRAECEHFVECVRMHRRPRTDGSEGIRVLQVLNAAQESLERGKVVKLITKAPVRQQIQFAHTSAVIDPDVIIGAGTRIWHFSHILSRTTIGEACSIGQNVVIGPDVTIGSHCKIQNNVSIYKGVTLEDYVFCGPSMVFTNVYNPRSEIRRMGELRPTYVERGATLGANCTIVCGVTIGRYAFVGAGAVVTRDVPPFVLVAGNPAKHMGWVCRCGESLGDKLKCAACEATYRKDGKGGLLEDTES